MTTAPAANPPTQPTDTGADGASAATPRTDVPFAARR